MTGAVEGLVAAGQHLTEAKAEHPGSFVAWLESGPVGLGPRTAQRLMEVARAFGQCVYVDALPPDRYALYELARLGPPELEAAIDAGEVSPDMGRKEAKALVARYRSGVRGDDEEGPGLNAPRVKPLAQRPPVGAPHIRGMPAVTDRGPVRLAGAQPRVQVPVHLAALHVPESRQRPWRASEAVDERAAGRRPSRSTCVASRPTMHHLVGLAEIAAMLGVSRGRADQLVHQAGFPEPEAVLTAGRIWRRTDVEAWARATGRTIRDEED